MIYSIRSKSALLILYLLSREAWRPPQVSVELLFGMPQVDYDCIPFAPKCNWQ